MKTENPIIGKVYTRNLFVFVLLFNSLLLAPSMCFGEVEVRNNFTLRVKLEEPIPVAVRHLSEYLRVVSVQDDRGNVLEPNHSLKIQKGFSLDVRVKRGIDVFRFAKPVQATLRAPIYLEKKVEVKRVAGVDLVDKKSTIRILKDGLGLVVEQGGKIANLEHNRQILDDVVILIFKEEVFAFTERIIGIRPVRKRSFELIDKWVSGGEEVRIRVYMPNIDNKTSQLAVGFWTDHPNSALEEEAYLADVTGIEQEKIGGYNYIVKAKVPYLNELKHVEPNWYNPFPPKVKVTVTTKPDENQIISETFDLRVSRRGWGFTAGLIFLFIVVGIIVYITRDFNPFKDGSEGYEKWMTMYKSSWIKQFFFSPLNFAITPFGTYSLSVAQALFWTFIVAFSCVYVYMLKAAFIMIPGQILILLGITGGTALASRINAISKDVVPKELMIGIEKKNIPRLRDMISIAGRMNIYKFQMMVFTIITGIIVLIELIKACNFPEIPDTLIMLMGLSNTLYLGNEVTIEPIEGLREKVKAYKEEADEHKKNELGKEIKIMLSEY